MFDAPLNSSMTTTLAKLDTLGSLISAYATVANDDWRARLLKAGPRTTGTNLRRPPAPIPPIRPRLGVEGRASPSSMEWQPQ
jgi:hypothetical protein